MYQHLSVEDGLPSSEVYDVLQDDDGFMWFATDRGIARYDGYEFDVFNTENGLLDNVVFHLQKDSAGRIWFDSYSGQICYYENGKIIPYKYNHIIQKEMKSPIITSFKLDKKGSVHLGTLGHGYLKISNDGRFHKQKSKRYKHFLVPVENTIIAHSTRKKPRHLSQEIAITTPSKEYIPHFDKKIKICRINTTSPIIDKNTFYASFNSDLAICSNDSVKIIKKFHSEIIYIAFEKKQFIVV